MRWKNKEMFNEYYNPPFTDTYLDRISMVLYTTAFGLGLRIRTGRRDTSTKGSQCTFYNSLHWILEYIKSCSF